jgi:hypothetical protein
MPSSLNPQGTRFLNRSFSLIAVIIQIQSIAGSSTDGADANYLGSIATPDEMLSPLLLSRIKQGQNRRRFSVATHHEVIASLVTTAAR